MFYIVADSYSPNSAGTNRILAYAKALSKYGIDTKIVFLQPDSQFSKYRNNLPHIEFIYYWDRLYINFPRLNKLSLRYYMRKFFKILQAGDKVYVYGCPDLVVLLSKRDDIYVYVERTEHNSAFFNGVAWKVTIPDFLKACRKINGVFVISQGLRESYIEDGCQPERVHIVNMIVDNERFLEVNKTSHERKIVYCGTASNTKDGVDQLIKAFSIVAQRYPDYKLYIVGNTPKKNQKFENLSLVKELGIEKNVVFTGVVPASEMPQILTNAAILALDRPNNLQAKYGFPTKLGEYLLTANPVVITSVGDIPLFLKDGESALIAEPDNPQCFADKLCWVIEHPIESIIIGEHGKKVALDNFDFLKETKKIIELLNL